MILKEFCHGIWVNFLTANRITFLLKDTWKQYFAMIEKHQRDIYTP